MRKRAYLLISHGSHNRAVKEEANALAEELQKRFGEALVVPAFLTINSPSISEGIKRCVEGGARHIILLLNFFSSGSHVVKDIPAILEGEKKKYKGIRFDIRPPIGQNPKIADLFKELADDIKDEPLAYS